MLASSQGDSTFAVFTRSGANDYLGSFQIGAEMVDDKTAGLDGSQASDGAHVVNVPLGDRYPQGLLVVHDGANQPEFTIMDDGEEVNANTNFKFVAWENVANTLNPPLLIDTTSYHPRTSVATSAAPTAPMATGRGQASAIFTLPDIPLAAAQNGALPNSIGNDRGILLGGIGSDLWRGADDPANAFWMVTDRGPNGQIEVDDKNRRTFPVPEFTPHILQVTTEGETITVQQAIPILTQSGQPVTGLSNLQDFTEQGWDYSAQEKLDFNPNGLDTEGLVRTRAGEFWLVEEYAPSLIHVGADGKVIKRYVPTGLDYSGADYPVTATLPALYSLRQNNRGFEGLALSPDETTLYLALQSPLSNPDKDTAEVSTNTRLLVFDIASATVTGEYVYVFDDPAGYGEEGAPDEMKLSGVVALSATSLLILERTDKVAKLYTVDLAAATNILATPWDDPATTPSLEAVRDLAAAQVTPLPKQLVIDLSQLPETPQKIEGVAVVDAQTLAIANDNDFNLGEFDAAGNNSNPPGIASHLLLVTLAEPLP